MTETVHCWEWQRNPESASPGKDYWSLYPGFAEEYDTHEVTIVFWKVDDADD